MKPSEWLINANIPFEYVEDKIGGTCQFFFLEENRQMIEDGLIPILPEKKLYTIKFVDKIALKHISELLR